MNLVSYRLYFSLQIVDGYWHVQRSLKTSVEELRRLFPYLNSDQEQFESIFHIRRELGKLFRVLPKNRLLEVDFSGIRQFQYELMEDIMTKNSTDSKSMFCNVTTMSFRGCFISCSDLELLSLNTQNLKSLTLPDRLMDHKINGKDVNPDQIQDFRTYQKKGLIGHRGRTTSHMKILWPNLMKLTFM
ncbi:hypothetical protein DICVIV_07533 [Dictyocaulus viviparus]|uniref:Leucine Rich repeat-containing domain protein n=1 Tax=Dictyocaulus viviparus TaxID=29172 RepID=A0A0D8XPF0_DICVI|nr:hypothetical protein DICVIV_07533 [Dictyocaulus viviparus]